MSDNATNTLNEFNYEDEESKLVTTVPLPKPTITGRLVASIDDAKAEIAGGKKFDGDKPRMELISSVALTELAKVLTFGAKKYAPNNWRNGIAYSRIVGACFRHLNAYNAGEMNDPETGLSHMAHLLCEAMFLLEFEKTHPELNDIYKIEVK